MFCAPRNRQAAPATAAYSKLRYTSLAECAGLIRVGEPRDDAQAVDRQRQPVFSPDITLRELCDYIAETKDVVASSSMMARNSAIGVMAKKKVAR